MPPSIRFSEHGGNQLSLLLEERCFDLLCDLGGLPQEVIWIPKNPIHSLCSYREDVSKVLVSGFLVQQEVLGSLSLRSLLRNAFDGFLELLPCLHAFFLLQVRKEKKRPNLIKVFKLQSLVKVRETFQSHVGRPCFPDLKVGDAHMSRVKEAHCKLLERIEGGSGSSGLTRADAGDGGNAFLGGNLKDPDGKDVLLMPNVRTCRRNV